MRSPAGKRRYRVQIKAKVTAKDSEGVTTDSYPAVTATLWVNVVPTGGEFIQRKFGVMDESVTLRMESLPHPAVVEGSAVVWQGQNYEIAYVARVLTEYTALLRPLQP
jgi:hypothetical protein